MISLAHAQGLSGSLAQYSQFLPIILIFGIFYFLLIRPQQTAQKKLRTRLAGLRRGDKVVTGGGFVGVVQRAKEGSNEIEVELAPNVRVIALRETITSVIDPATPTAS